MKKPLSFLFILLAICISLLSCSSVSNKSDSSSEDYSYLKENFKTPPSEYGVNCWWWWINGNVNKAAITKDLEAMKSRNFQGAMIFDAGGHNQRGNKDIPAGPLFGSDEWNELFVFALDEAERLGLDIGFNIQSGWNLGGPRVTPEYTAKQITFSETVISGDQEVRKKLELPSSRKDFYIDIAVLAFPVGDKNKMIEEISDLDLKLGYRELGGSAPDCRFLLTNSARNGEKSQDKTAFTVKKEEIIDLTSRLDQDGNLSWDAPEGEWNVIRIGYTCTASHVSTSSEGWTGNVLDYMSKEAFDFYWDDVVEPIFKAAGDHVGETLKFMETDSWECGGMNWTDNFAEEFMNYRGYDIINYLPIVAGYVIEDINSSNAFLADFRKTIGDLVAYNHYARFQEYAHKYNMGVQPESAGPHAGPMDGIKNYGFSDIVMSEFWSPSPHRPRPENRFYLKQASSAAHIYGKKIVGAESFTTIGPQWNDELWHDQKSAFDHEICAGLNRLYFHTFTCSPPEMGLPGQEYFAGTHVNPQVTWWDQSGPFIDYMHRTQLVVQNGKFVADVLYYYGDHVPNVFPFKHSDPAGVMPGFDYDVSDETILLKLKMKNGKLVVPGGVEYRVLVLPDHNVLSMAVLEKVEKLLNQGAHIIGNKPEQLVSIVGGENEQKQYHLLVDKIWGKDAGEKGEKEYGKGNLAWGLTAREYLLSKDIPVDFNIIESESKTDYDYIHYTIGESEIYFVTNQSTDRKKINCQFRVSGLQPELWDALTGETRNAKAFYQSDGLTTVPLTFEPYGAVIVVFNKQIDKNKQGTVQSNHHDYNTVKSIEGEWEVSFDPKWGGPSSVTFPELIDWTLHPEEGIKYYSGTAVYTKAFNLDFAPQNDKHYFLQLGSVKDVGIAEVKINGMDKGIVWTKPFRVEISKELQKGENSLEITVVNSWYNRVAGDEILELENPYTSTNIIIAHDFRGRSLEEIPLEPSGLLGPVTIKVADEDMPILQNPMSESYLKENITKSKPRMVFNQQIVEDLKIQIKADPVIKNMYEAVRINAYHTLDEPLLERIMTGRRLLGVSRNMLHRINLLGVVYMIENDPVILNRIDKEVKAVCNFSDWNPSHYLDVAEMAMAVAFALDWTSDQLPETTIHLAKKALIEKGIYPGWPEYGGQNYWWINTHNNWNQVCHGGMIAASIAIADDDPKLAAQTIKRALDKIPLALSEYMPDGVYPEGAGYWTYGTSFSVVSAEMFETSFGTDFGLKEYPGFMESAIYKVMCSSPSGLYYNFADCGDKKGASGDNILAWFAAKSGNANYYEKDLFLSSSESMNLNRFSGAALAWMSQYTEHSTVDIPTEWFGRGTNPIAIFKDETQDRSYYFGAKGGGGILNHGNMDAGSFIFELDNIRWVIDPGVQAYHELEKTGFDLWGSCQNCDRWKLLTKNNYGHSTLTVNGELHVANGLATMIDFKEGENPEVTFDLSPVFKGNLNSATRRFIKNGDASLLIEDNIDINEETEYVTWQLITTADVEIVNSGAILKKDGKELKLNNLSHPEIGLRVIVLDPPPYKLDKHIKNLKRIEFKIPVSINNNGNSLNIRVSLEG